MPNFECERRGATVSSDLDVAFMDAGASPYYMLRRRNPLTNKFSAAGDCADYGIVRFPPRLIGKLSELCGFLEGVEIPKDADGTTYGEVLWRVSSDGGATWHYHDSSEWVEQPEAELDDDDFGTMRDMDKNVATYPKADANNFVWHCKIIPDETKKWSPRVAGAAVQGEVFAFDIEELHKSVQRVLSEQLLAPLWTREEVSASAPTKVKIRTKMKVVDVVACYSEGTVAAPNTITNRTNIFASLDGKEVTLAGGPYPEGTRVRVEFHGRPDKKAFTSVDTEFYDAELPALLLELPSVEQAREFSNHQIQDKSPYRDTIRERRAPERVYMRMHIKAKASRKAEADGLAQGLRDLIETTGIRSYQTGEKLQLWKFDYYKNRDNVAANVFQRELDVVLLGTLHGGNPYTTFHKVKSIGMGVVLTGNDGVVAEDAVATAESVES